MMNPIRKFGKSLAATASFGSILATSAIAYAAPQSFSGQSAIGQTTDSNFSTIPSSGAHTLTAFFQNFGTQILNIALLLIAIVAVLFLLFYAFQYITAGGDPEKAKKARGGIINAIIGIIVAALAFSIVHFALTGAGTINNAANNVGTGSTTL